MLRALMAVDVDACVTADTREDATLRVEVENGSVVGVAFDCATPGFDRACITERLERAHVQLVHRRRQLSLWIGRRKRRWPHYGTASVDDLDHAMQSLGGLVVSGCEDPNYVP